MGAPTRPLQKNMVPSNTDFRVFGFRRRRRRRRRCRRAVDIVVVVVVFIAARRHGCAVECRLASINRGVCARALSAPNHAKPFFISYAHIFAFNPLAKGKKRRTKMKRVCVFFFVWAYTHGGPTEIHATNRKKKKHTRVQRCECQMKITL